MDIKATLLDERLPVDAVVVAGSGLLQALGLREATDLDIVVGDSLFSRISSDQSWRRYQSGSDQACGKGKIEAWHTWYGKSYEEVLRGVVTIDGVRYMNEQQTIAWKAQLGREKDYRDIELLRGCYED